MVEVIKPGEVEVDYPFHFGLLSMRMWLSAADADGAEKEKGRRADASAARQTDVMENLERDSRRISRKNSLKNRSHRLRASF
ncbi:MAG TPA: hypothetical protein VEF03_02710 [Candidatus Binataceae bacterium]|nr:hypothetical protein [Candidatus Binataceae bacterium]